MIDFQKMLFSAAVASLTIGLLVCASACDKYEPVAVAKCSKIVKHSRKLLAGHADSYSKSMADCKSASDQERGCAMVADSPADLLRCSM